MSAPGPGFGGVWGCASAGPPVSEPQGPLGMSSNSFGSTAGPGAFSLRFEGEPQGPPGFGGASHPGSGPPEFQGHTGTGGSDLGFGGSAFTSPAAAAPASMAGVDASNFGGFGGTPFTGSGPAAAEPGGRNFGASTSATGPAASAWPSAAPSASMGFGGAPSSSDTRASAPNSDFGSSGVGFADTGGSAWPAQPAPAQDRQMFQYQQYQTKQPARQDFQQQFQEPPQQQQQFQQSSQQLFKQQPQQLFQQPSQQQFQEQPQQQFQQQPQHQPSQQQFQPMQFQQMSAPGQPFSSQFQTPPLQLQTMQGDDGSIVESRNCSCGQPAANFTVKKEGPNKGRIFFKCGKPQTEQPCQFFEWADEAPRASRTFGSGPGPGNSGPSGGSSLPDGPPCSCGIPTVQLTVRKEGPNQGRTFFKCNNQQNSCGLFQWADEEAAPPGPPCQCGVPSSQRKVQKEGPNRGRPFFACPRKACDFFAWGDEEPGGQGGHVPTPARSGGKGGGSDVCFHCNQPGHWASNCPNKADGGYGKAGGKVTKKGGGRGSRGGRGRGRKDVDDFDGGFTGSFPSDGGGERFAPY